MSMRRNLRDIIKSNMERAENLHVCGGPVLSASGLCIKGGTITAADQTADPVCVFDSQSMPTLQPSNIEIIQRTPDDLMMDGEEGVIHLQIQQSAAELEEPLNGGHVFYVYRDAFTCGACSKEMDDMVEFIQHKSLHTLGLNVCKCELCKLVFSERLMLMEHYHNQHGLDFSVVIPKEEQKDSFEPPSPSQASEISPPIALVDSSPPLKPLSSSSSKRRKSVQKERKDTETEEATEEVDGILTEDVEHTNSPGEEQQPEEKEESKDFTFILSSETIKGAKLTFTRSWFKCLHCDYRSRMKRCLVKHMGEKHEDTFAAVHDNMEVKGEEGYALNNQKVGETQSRLMRMSVYDRLYPIMGHKRKRRLEKQDIPGVYTCNQCNKVFSRLRYLRKHSKQHTVQPTKAAATDRRFTCEQCGKMFKFKHYLQAHKSSHNVKMFQCNECDFRSNINAAIHAHRQVHNQGSVLCDICGYAYSDRSTLTKHYRVHDLTRPFACNFPGCTWRFKTDIMCRAHIRAHTTEGKFRCWLCGYVFRHKHHLQRHVSKMHKLKLSVKEIDAQCKYQSPTPLETKFSLQCKDCGLDFDNKQQLEQHFTKFHHIQLSVQEIDDFCNANLLNNSTEHGDSKLVITAEIAPQDFDQNAFAAMDSNGDQPVYIAIDQGTLSQFEADPNTLDVSQMYVQEEHEIPTDHHHCTIDDEDDPNDDKSYFVSVL